MGSAAACMLPLRRTAAQAAVPPSRTVTMAIIGYGGRCRQMLPVFLGQPGVRFLAVCDAIGERRVAAKKAVDDVIAKAKLEKVAGQTIETLSKGYRQRTAFAAVIIHDPKVLIMDEPTDGLDPNQKFTVREMIKSMAKEGKAIIISTHILEEVDAVCTKVVVIADGEKKFDGTPAELKAKDPSGKLDVVFRNLTMKA